jgi:hypothetical protein
VEEGASANERKRATVADERFMTVLRSHEHIVFHYFNERLNQIIETTLSNIFDCKLAFTLTFQILCKKEDIYPVNSEELTKILERFYEEHSSLLNDFDMNDMAIIDLHRRPILRIIHGIQQNRQINSSPILK